MKSSIFFDDIIFDLQQFGGISEYWRQLSSSPVLSAQFNIQSFGRLGSSKRTKFGKLSAKFSRCSTVTHGKAVFHSSYYRLPSNQMPTVVTVHDFIYEKRVSGLASFVNAYQIRKAIKTADSIICISNATRNDLLCLMPEIDERRIEVVYHGVDHATFNNKVVIGDTNAQFSDCVMFVGKRAGYKNFALAVSVLAELNDLRLLVIGEQLTKDEQEYLTKYLGSRWVSMDGINNRDLANLYRYCFCLIYPSDYEGFGMPVLEAMACGCPVITSSAEALVEIGGSASLKADNTHIDSYVDKVAAILQNRDMIVASGFEHVKSFSWDLTAQKMSKIYRLYS